MNPPLRLVNLPSNVKIELDKLLDQDLQSPEILAKILQNLPAARSYLYEQMLQVERRLEQDRNNKQLSEEHERIRRLFFEVEETAINLGKILSYQTALMKMER